MKYYHKIMVVTLCAIVFGWGQTSADAYVTPSSLDSFSSFPLPSVKPEQCMPILSAQTARSDQNRKAIAAVALGLYVGLNAATLPDDSHSITILPLAHCTGRGVVSPLP